MKQVNVHEAKTHFSRLLADVEAGEEIVVARKGRPVARIIREPEQPRRSYRNLGPVPGWETWTFDEQAFREADEDILADFEESLNKPVG